MAELLDRQLAERGERLQAGYDRARKLIPWVDIARALRSKR